MGTLQDYASTYKAMLDAHDAVDSEYKEKLAAFEEANKDLIAKRTAAKKLVDDAENKLRDEAMRIYDDTGKAPDEAYAGVRVYKSVVVNNAVFIDWCIKNAPALITGVCKVDEKRLQRVLEGITDDDGSKFTMYGMPADLVDKPTVTISKAKLPDAKKTIVAEPLVGEDGGEWQPSQAAKDIIADL